MTPTAASAANAVDGVSDPRAVRASLPRHVREGIDAIFDDADRHGPRAPELLRRSLLAIAAVVVAMGLASSSAWRDFVFSVVGASEALDPLLIAPVVLAIVIAAALTAPCARMPALRLVPVAIVFGVLSAWLVARGDLAAATVPGIFAALAAGTIAARALRRAVWALPVLLAAGVSDAHSVSNGVTRSLLDGAGSVASAVATTISAPTVTIDPAMVTRLDYVVIHVPVANGVWLLGLVDVLALALLLGLTHLYWLPVRRTAVALGVALAGAVLIGSTIPMLPLLGAAWVAVHARLVWRSTRFSIRRLTYLGG